MADKTLKMWLQHVRSQVAEILSDYSLHMFPWNILQLFYMPFSRSPYHLFVSLLLSFSSPLSLSLLSGSAAASAILFGPFSFSFVFLLGGCVGGSCEFSWKISIPEKIRRFYNALLVGRRGAERSRD